MRDSKTQFTFFNVEGGQYDYDANARSLSITDGRLLISKQFADALGRPSDAGSIIGKISVGAAMQPIEITQLLTASQSVVVPPLSPCGPGRLPWWPGPISSLGTCRTWNNSAARDHRLAWRWGRLPATTATRRSIFLHCQILIIRSFRKIFIG